VSTVAPGQLIYVRSDGVSTSFGGDPARGTLSRENHEMWLDPQGMIMLGIVSNGEDLTQGPKSDHAGQVAQARAQLATDGPSLLLPTPQWLAQLPTDPAALRGELLADIGESKWSDDHTLVTALGDLLWTSEPLVGPQARVALYRVLAGVEGLTATETVVENRQVYAIGHSENGVIDELLFDRTTGAAVGRRSGLEGEAAAGVTVTPAAGVEAPADPGITAQSVWTHRIVAAVGAR
jgi:hypothetical protein